MDPRHEAATASSLPTGALGAGDIVADAARPARSRLSFMALAFSIHAMALLVVSVVPPDPWGLAAEELLGADERLAPYTTEALELVEQVEVSLASPVEEPEPGAGRRHLGEQGGMGDREAAATGARHAIEGPRRELAPRMTREWPGLGPDATAGIVTAVRLNAPSSPFGDDVASGRDPENALGLLMGNRIGNSFGYGGLGVRGTGRGGGGDGAGTIGLGGLRTIGHGGTAGGSGYGACGALDARSPSDSRGGVIDACAAPLRRHSGSIPTVHFCGPAPCMDIRGSLSKEVIRRHIRRNINSIRYCYEKELIARPDLEGRVAVRFMISAQGAVVSSTVESSTLGEPVAEQCVARAVERIGFPQTDDGLPVLVTYPFVFASVE
jgi:TonB family protein